MTIRLATAQDKSDLLHMRLALWPNHDGPEHLQELDAMLSSGSTAVFIALDGDAPIGFAEASIRRDYVTGCVTTPVGFLEGLYTAPDARRGGVARGLVAAVEAWAVSAGCRELASDAHLDNTISHLTHEALGFEETERVVYFRKDLPPA